MRARFLLTARFHALVKHLRSLLQPARSGLFMDDWPETSPATREAVNRLGFTPEYHSLVETGPFVGSWALSTWLGTTGTKRSNYVMHLFSLEGDRIKAAGGTVVTIDLHPTITFQICPKDS
jgi:hypothetical protein